MSSCKTAIKYLKGIYVFQDALQNDWLYCHLHICSSNKDFSGEHVAFDCSKSIWSQSLYQNEYIIICLQPI